MMNTFMEVQRTLLFVKCSDQENQFKSISGRIVRSSLRILLLLLGLQVAMQASALPLAPRSVNDHGGLSHRAVCASVEGAGVARCHARVLINSDGSIHTHATPLGFAPADLRSAYNITQDGDGTLTVAIVDAYGYRNAERDLNIYRAQFGLSPCTRINQCFQKVNQDGVAAQFPRESLGWAEETALDLDMVSAICPKCKILLVEANSNSYADLAAAVMTAAQMGAHAISNSYGGSESSNSPTYDSAYDHPGIAVTVSSGDSGYWVEFPASSPHVTAVGGTSLYQDATTARGWSETIWNGAGSGCSAYFAKPSWQTDTGCLMRTIADVSAVADPYTGVAVYAPVNFFQSAWQVYGGTSVASPLIAAIYALNGAPVTYGSAPYADPAGLNDVVSGLNASCGTYLCQGAVGYDGPSGLGTPNGSGAF